MIFRTESGSQYEVDSSNKKIRRHFNLNNKAPLNVQPKDEEWKSYHSISDNVVIGESVYIVWDTNDKSIFHTAKVSEIVEANKFDN